MIPKKHIPILLVAMAIVFSIFILESEQVADSAGIETNPDIRIIPLALLIMAPLFEILNRRLGVYKGEN